MRLRLFVGKLVVLPFVIDRPPNIDRRWSNGSIVESRNDRDRDSPSGPLLSRPLILEHAITAPIEVSILRETIERLGRPVEARRNVMATVIARTTFRCPRLPLRCPRPDGCLGNCKHASNAARPLSRIYLLIITIANDRAKFLARHACRSRGSRGRRGPSLRRNDNCRRTAGRARTKFRLWRSPNS